MKHNAHCGSEPKWGFFTKILCWLVGIYDAISHFLSNLFHSKKNNDVVPPQRPKVAFISVYGIPCGIATYNQELIEELKEFADIRVFAEYAGVSRDEKLPEYPEWVVRCWSRYYHPKKKLMSFIDKWNPDIIHISHEYGFFSRAYFFTSLVSKLKLKGYKVVATMHSVYDHLDKAVSEACVPNIIVHSEAAKSTLVKKGINNNIYVIPHGVKVLTGTNEKPELLEAYWNHWNSEHTIFQPGFMFDYKGHSNIIKIVAELKEKYPDICYIIQGSENPFNLEEHEKVYQKLVKLATELDVLDNITINRGFVETNVLLSYIRTVKCCVLPYEMHPDHDVKGASGIAKLIINTTTPLVTSSVHMFDDLTEVATRCFSFEDMKNVIDDIFSNDILKNSQIAKRKQFLKENNWGEIANKVSQVYTKMLQ